MSTKQTMIQMTRGTLLCLFQYFKALNICIYNTVQKYCEQWPFNPRTTPPFLVYTYYLGVGAHLELIPAFF